MAKSTPQTERWIERETEQKKNMRNEHRIRANDKQQRSEHVTQKKQNGKRSQNEILKQKHAIYFTLT